MTKYMKLIAAIVGLLAIILTDVINITPDGTTADTVREAVLGLLTALGVYQVRNET